MNDDRLRPRRTALLILLLVLLFAAGLLGTIDLKLMLGRPARAEIRPVAQVQPAPEVSTAPPQPIGAAAPATQPSLATATPLALNADAPSQPAATAAAAQPAAGETRDVPAAAAAAVSGGQTRAAAPPAAVVQTPAQILAQLSLEEKVGQMAMYSLTSTDGSGAIASLVAQRHIGNAVLLDDNVVGLSQLDNLTGNLPQMGRAANDGIGMFISADQEGGSVQRLPPPSFVALPSARQMAATGDPAGVTSLATETAREMLRAGVNMDLAPVLDVNDNPANPVIGYRAFGVEPQPVITYGLAFRDGLRAGGVASVVKHFPGHGNTSQDSHLTLPYVTKTDAQLESVELAPFRAAIANGADAVMIDHVVYTAWDPDRPASLSPIIVQGILRNTLGFQGVVMTDDLSMGAIVQHHSPGEAAVMAVQAGVDVLLSAGSPASQAAAVDAVVAAVRDGRISEARIDESVLRILTLKRQYGLLPGQ